MNEIEKAIELIKNSKSWGWISEEKYYDIAIQALQEKFDREKQPEPLSLERLKQMDGDPIWLQRNESGRWRICAGVIDNSVLLDGIPDKVFFSDYVFYTRKPRQEP